MVKANRILGRQKRDYSQEAELAVAIMTQDDLRESPSNFNYDSLEIESTDKKELLEIEKDMVFQGKRLGETAYRIGENLEKAREIFKKYSTVEGDPESFTGWYHSLGFNKDQVYLFRGRFRLCLEKPQYKENILVLSDRAVKEAINRNTPPQIVEKVLEGSLKTGKDIKEAREEFKISSTLDISENAPRTIDVQVEITPEELRRRKEREITFIRKDIKEREAALKKLYKELKVLEAELAEI